MGGNRTTEERRARLAELMARLAAGDRTASCALALEFSGPIGGAVRHHLRDVGVADIERDELDGLVMDVCLMLGEVAAAWRPDGGALPWHWAWHRVRAIVSRWVGQHADGFIDVLAEEADPAPAVGDEPDVLALFESMARRLPEVALVREGLASVASPRDQAIVLEVGVQVVMGDPSPAVTVATLRDLRPEAVRQVLSRTRRRLRALADEDERFAPLADLPLAA